MRLCTVVVGLSLAFLLPAAAGAAEPRAAVDTASLLTELVDLGQLAEWPDPPFTCRQFSSYDRASKTPDNAEAWFANGDAGQYLRVEERDGRKEHVMMDADGPGAIVRIWSANPKGTLRIYLDGAAEPALTAPMTDLLSGKVPGIPEPIAHTASSGWNCYYPFPYAKHCKVTSDEGDFYYHVNYRTYPAGTALATFNAAELQRSAGDVQKVVAALAPGPPKTPESEHQIAPGETVEHLTVDGKPAALVELTCRLADVDEAAARQVLLLIDCDGARTVEVPLVDFCGAGPGRRAYRSLPLSIGSDGLMQSRWVMPFAKSFRLAFRNAGSAPVRLRAWATTDEWNWTPRSMHFHAGWRVERDVPTRPMQDWNYLSAKGQGVFVGAAFTIANPVKTWWGEGDEKIYVDGETFPSHFGTGTEDYYGYAWCDPKPFANPYHAQPQCDGPNNYGRTAVNRWHVIDKIPFTRDFRFDMELWHWSPDVKVPEMAVVTYWYARPGATSNRTPPDAKDLAVATIPPYVVPRVKGALEGEELKVVSQAGKPQTQDIGGCSNEKQLWWTQAKPGDKLVVSFPAPAAGRFRVFGRFVKSFDYGIIQLYVNGKKVGEPIDFYNKDIAVTDEQKLGVFELKPDGNELTAEVVGTSDKVTAKNYMFGLDYLRLEAE